MSESSCGARGKHWSADHSVGRFSQQRRGAAPPSSYREALGLGENPSEQA